MEGSFLEFLDEIIIQIQFFQARHSPEGVCFDERNPVLGEIKSLKVPELLEGVRLDGDDGVVVEVKGQQLRHPSEGASLDTRQVIVTQVQELQLQLLHRSKPELNLFQNGKLKNQEVIEDFSTKISLFLKSPLI